MADLDPTIGTDIPKEIIVQEESIKTGGNFQATSLCISVPATSGWHEATTSFPFDISLMSGEWIAHDNYEGDKIEFLVGEDTVVGVITADISVDDTEISVNQTVIDYTKVGFYIKIDSEELGRIVSVDADNLKIIVETAATSTHSATAAVKQTVKMAMDITLKGGAGAVVIADKKIGGTNIPANTVIKLRYNNISETAKDFSAILEYMY